MFIVAVIRLTVGSKWAKGSISNFLTSNSFTSLLELPSKEGKLTTHDGKTVTDLFPEFRPGQVLRFSRLFGPAKASSMPQQWRNAKKRKKKKKKQGEDEKATLEPPKSPPSPLPEDCMSDDEVSNVFGGLFFFFGSGWNYLVWRNILGGIKCNVVKFFLQDSCAMCLMWNLCINNWKPQRYKYM